MIARQFDNFKIWTYSSPYSSAAVDYREIDPSHGERLRGIIRECDFIFLIAFGSRLHRRCPLNNPVAMLVRDHRCKTHLTDAPRGKLSHSVPYRRPSPHPRAIPKSLEVCTPTKCPGHRSIHSARPERP